MAYVQNPENPANFFNIAGETAKTLAMWPMYQYAYSPGMYSASRGAIRAPFSGQGLRKLARTMRRLPKGAQAVDWAKRTFDIDTSSNVMRSKEIWWGLTEDKSRFKFGLSAVVDKPSMTPTSTSMYGLPKSKLKAMRMAQGTRQRVLPSTVRNLFGESPLSEPSGYKFRPAIMNSEAQRKLRNVAGRPDYNIMKSARMSDKGYQTFGIGPRVMNPANKLSGPIPQNLRYLAGETDVAVAARVAGRTAGRAAKYGAKIAPKLGRLGVKAGILGMKGFAYYQVGKLMWDTINFVTEPVGRASVQAMDSAFRAYESVPQVEMGGQISMAYLTHGSATERSRAINAISKAHINGRSTLGAESSYVHR